MQRQISQGLTKERYPSQTLCTFNIQQSKEPLAGNGGGSLVSVLVVGNQPQQHVEAEQMQADVKTQDTLRH